MEIINSKMKFANFKDFYTKADIIEYEYRLLSLNEKWLYKEYVYSHEYVDTYLKNAIWEFLNEPFGSVYYLSKEMLGVYL